MAKKDKVVQLLVTQYDLLHEQAEAAVEKYGSGFIWTDTGDEPDTIAEGIAETLGEEGMP